MGEQLRVHVNDELVLDVGAVESSDEALIIRRPKVTLFHQVLDYLRAKPDAFACSDDHPDSKQEGWAAVSVVLRWGSYFAVLADATKPISSAARSSAVSRISDAEMARINIEASAAFAEWVDIARTDDSYTKLVNKALHYLPRPELRSKRSEQEAMATVREALMALAMPSIAAKVVDGARSCFRADVFADVSARADASPSRLFANAVVNTVYRNGPIENVHAGEYVGYSLDRRRVTLSEERAVLGFAVDGFKTAMRVCRQFALEHPSRAWSAQVLPYGLHRAIAPFRWTFTEATRDVRLPHYVRRPPSATPRLSGS